MITSNNGEIIENIVLINSTKVVISREPHSADYENNKWPYFLVMPISIVLTIWVMIKKFICHIFLHRIPNINTIWFDGLGLSCRGIKDGSASWKSLDIIYNYQFGKQVGLAGIIDDFWIGMVNAQAVRNRLKLIKKEITAAILQCYDGANEVRIISIAAGSAQGIIEIVSEFKKKGIVVRSLLIDIDQTAVDYSIKLAEENGVGDQVEAVKASAATIEKFAHGFKPHIIEMLGLLDYIPQDKAVRLVVKIHKSLASGGIFLTCNIRHNFEMFFLKWVINWKMLYRNSKSLAEVAVGAGFNDVKVIYEPHGIHGIVIAQKD